MSNPTQFHLGAALALGAVIVSQSALATEIRVATFNASLNRFNAGDLVTDLSTPDNEQAKAVAEIIQRVNPDILLINEFDFDAAGQALSLFQSNYLGIAQNGATPVNYAYAFTAPSNTGVPTGFDMNNDGSVGGANDAQGFGFFEGQFGMAVYSKYEIDTSNVRTFQNFLWKDMPGALLPADPIDADGDGDMTRWYTDAELGVQRLSSKSHWDIPVQIDGETVHVLAAHPTPPVFDGVEDRNGLRNHDEIRLFADYVDPAESAYIYDDNGTFGGLGENERFVIVGDYNADPFDGDSANDAIRQLLDNALINAGMAPSSAGGAEQSGLQGGANDLHVGDPAFDTADFADGNPGNLRVDYVLPSVAGLKLLDTGVFWPLAADPRFGLVGTFPFPSSDHRLVYADLQVTAVPLAPTALLVGLGWIVARRRFCQSA
jgi:3-phytase/alkaline phosphatase D